MDAYRYPPEEGKAYPKHERLEIPEPGPKEVLLQVLAAGLCHSDLHLIHAPKTAYGGASYTMSHEICGKLVKVGSGLPSSAKLLVGSTYAVVGPNGCDMLDETAMPCKNCNQDRSVVCHHQISFPGIGRDGGYADYVTVPWHSLVPVPEGVSPEVAAVATDSTLTPYHAAKRARLQAGDNVLVIGLGGLGLNQVQVSKLLGATVYATDVKSDACDIAKKVGATLAKPDLNAEDLKDVDINVVFDCVGADSTFNKAQDLVGRGGRIVIVGLGERELKINTSVGVRKEWELLQTFWGTQKELKEVLNLIAEGKLNPPVSTRPLSDIQEYFGLMAQGKLQGRVAFIPKVSAKN